MNSEEKFNKAEQTNQPENKAEKELSLSEIDELIKESEKISVSLNEFSKEEIYKGKDFVDLRTRIDKPDNRFDEVAYAEAGSGRKYSDFFRKFDYFSRFSLNKERFELSKSKEREKYGLLKSKERGLLDKTKINENVVGKSIEIGQNNKQERKYLEDNVLDVQGDFKKDGSERTIAKAFEIVDGKMVKYVASSRTEKGQIEAAGKMREAEISRLETVNGKELVGLKESIEKNKQTKENMLKMSGFMSEKGKQDLTDKLDKEEADKKERIKEKEEKIADEIIIFREPLEGRLKETTEIQNNLSESLDFIKAGESNLNKKMKECEAFIKEAQKLSLSDEVRADIVKNAEAKKAEMGVQVKEFTEKKILISSRLDVLKTNKKEIETTLDRVNAIGKTKEEIENAKKEKSDKKSETKTEKIEEKENEKEKKGVKWDNVLNQEYKRGSENKENQTNAKEKSKILTEDEYGTKLSEEDIKERREMLKKNEDKINSRKNYKEQIVAIKERAKKGDLLTVLEKAILYGAEKMSEFDEEDTKDKERDEVIEKTFTKEEITEIVIRELKALKVSSLGGSDEEKRVRLEAMKDFPMLAKLIFTKYKGKTEEKDIKKEVQEWYKRFTKKSK